MRTSKMNHALRSGILATMTIAVLYSCQKREEVFPQDNGALTAQGGEKSIDAIVVAGTWVSTTNTFFRVLTTCKPDYGLIGIGEVEQTDLPVCNYPGTDPIHIVAESASQMRLLGSSIYGGPGCLFTKGSNPQTLGPTYFIKAYGVSNAPKLSIRVRGYASIPPPPDAGCGWFRFDEAQNTWFAQPGANAYFKYNTNAIMGLCPPK